MLNRTQIISEITRMATMKELVEAYEEIAATRMRRVRSTVLQTRDFLAGLTQIFQEVKSSYKKQIEILMKRKKIKDTKKLSVIKRNGKIACILLASNTGLYGDIVRKTYLMFVDYLKKNPVDSKPIIIGRLGKSFFEADHKGKDFKYFDFPDSGVDKESMKSLIDEVVQYEKILVFYGKFENIVYQNPIMLDMYGEENEVESGKLKVESLGAQHLGGDRMGSSEVDLSRGKHLKGERDDGQGAAAYFFEPSLEEVLIFFEGQMFGSIFEQTVHESDLAKYAARMFTLDKATENIRRNLKIVEFQKRVIDHRMMNKKQLGAISGFTLWKKR